MAQKLSNPAIMREANGRYYIISDEKQQNTSTPLTRQGETNQLYIGLKTLIATQVQLAMSAIDRVTMPTTPSTHTATMRVAPITHFQGVKWVMESPYEITLEYLLKDAELFGIKGYITQGVGSNTNYFLVLDEKYDILSHSEQREKKDARKTQRAMTQDELAAEILGTPIEHTPIVHEAKEFVDDDIIVSQEDLDALKQIEDLEDLGDINLDELDLGDLDDLDDLEDLDIDDNDDLEDLGI
jgi:hypothetical protein